MFDIAGNPDTKVLMPFSTFSKSFQFFEPSIDIVVKGLESDKGLEEAEAEIIGLLRTKRGLKPRQETNFSINRPEAATKCCPPT